MLRNTLLYLSRQPRIFRFVRHNGLAKGFASRFVAGETIASACEAVAELNAAGIAATLELPRGAFVIASQQPLGLLAAILLEPESDDGLTTWNLLDTALTVGAPHPVQRVLAPLPSSARPSPR